MTFVAMGNRGTSATTQELESQDIEVIVIVKEKVNESLSPVLPKKPKTRGILSKYSNPSLIPHEKSAWSKAAMDKHANR